MDNKAFKVGFIDDINNSHFNETFKNGSKLKDVHIEIYPNNPIESNSPFELLLRAVEKKALVLNDGNRLVLKLGNKFETCVLNILLSNITKCFVEVNESDVKYSSYILKVQNIWYRITVLD